MLRGPKGERRPADVIGNAVHVMRIATGEIEDTKATPRTENRQKGGLKGGKVPLDAWMRIMQTPVEIDFQGMSGTPEIHASIEKHVAELEQRYGRVTACRVVLKGPGGHHRTGGLYEVNIRLALPNGREVNVGRTAQADERQAGLSFAINDAFKHVRRRLQDHVRRLSRWARKDRRQAQ